jgi:hypothetical protein
MNILKPYFVHRPSQLARRAVRQFWKPDQARVELPWGGMLNIAPNEAIGNAIWLTGVHEIATTEAIFRLLPPGGNAIDVGANMGYMTVAMMAACGKDGSIVACEPHPDIFPILTENVALNNSDDQRNKSVSLRELALSDKTGTASLSTDPEAINQGTSSLIL